MTDVKSVREWKWEHTREKVGSVCMCARRKKKVLLWNIQCDRRLYRRKIPSLERERDRAERRSREEEEKGVVIEVLDKSHKARDHFNRVVSYCESSCRTVRAFSIFKQCVGLLFTPYSTQYTCGACRRWACVIFHWFNILEKTTVSGRQILIQWMFGPEMEIVFSLAPFLWESWVQLKFSVGLVSLGRFAKYIKAISVNNYDILTLHRSHSVGIQWSSGIWHDRTCYTNTTKMSIWKHTEKISMCCDANQLFFCGCLNWLAV